MMSQIEPTEQDTEDILMPDIREENSEAIRAAAQPRLPRKLPSLPTSSEIEEPQIIIASQSSDSKAAENLIGESSYELSEAQEEVKNVEIIHQRAHTFERKFNEAKDLNINLQVAYTISQNELNELKRNHEALQRKHAIISKNTMAQVRDAEGRKKQAEANTQIALIRVEDISEELRKCKDELFNLQPPNQVADTQIGAEWEALCSSITTWIDDQSGGIGDLRCRLIELKGKELSKSFDEYWGEDRQLIANAYSKTSNILDELLRYNIHCLLEDRVFDDRVYMVGLRSSDAELLHVIEQNLGKLEPQRDPSSIGLWRSEALVALASTSGYGKLLEKATRMINDEARDFLEPLLPRRAPSAMSAFHRDITMPAVKLASTMRQSTANYHFVFRVSSNRYEEGRPPLRPPGKGSLLYKSDLEEIDVLDVGTRITLKKGRDYEAAKDGSIAESILEVHPALFCKRATESILLSRQVVLADMFGPPQRRGQPRDVEGSRGLLDKWSFKFNS